MNKLTLGQIAHIVDGEYIGDVALKNRVPKRITCMENEVEKEDFCWCRFVEPDAIIRGTKRLVAKGILCVMTAERLEPMAGQAIILVDSLRKASCKLAEYLRGNIRAPLIAITGSVGKTTTKDIINSVLSQKYKVLATSSYENVCFTHASGLSKYNDEEVVVIESAIGLPDTSHENGRILRPDAVVLTNIGESHLKNFGGSREALFHAKASLLEYLSPMGTAYINGGDEFLKRITVNKPARQRTYGRTQSAGIGYFARNICNLGLEGTNVDLCHEDIVLNVTIPVPGVHFVENALAAFAIGLDFGVALEDIKNGIESFEMSAHRSNVIKTDYLTIIEDCYNASPKSVMAGIDTLAALSGRRGFIFGEMQGLGEKAVAYHEEVGRYAAPRLDYLIAVGEFAEQVVASAKNWGGGLNCLTFSIKDKKDLPKILQQIVQKDDTVLVKAANACRFEEVTEMLRRLSGGGSEGR